ncbi:DUF11 domain-containing protein [Leucobacter weissii]|uniref:DUF11 domain-containing protein n=1 Tax=Leucobacter weissii TaxID=1983706 RepID=A0A939S9T1_9MICO|nr:DUF11 domain-containing protein [Leucobacter weissii]MBO1901242.1 DUF11 domain-containing protein [Leucobacter weissii]
MDAPRRAGGRRSERGARRLRRWIAEFSAAALAAGLLVTAGVGVQSAFAASPSPAVTASVPGTVIAGEDVRVQLAFVGDPAAGDQYNLSAGILLPEGVTVVDTGTLGAPTVYPTSPSDRVIPGVYANFPGECAVLGLEPAVPPHSQGPHACQVPAGKQYLVFQNISDLPQNARTTHTLTLRPDADAFPVGSDALELAVTAYTSADERYIPVLPGTRSVSAGNAHTSEPGTSALPIPVGALRIEKSEPSPESELLRGVHENTTTYTLRVFHTGEGDLEDVVVTDFLPAGLEYLGLGGQDRTSNANGTRGEQAEYPGAPSLSGTPAPADSTEGGPRAGRNAATVGETVSTVIPTAQEVADYGLSAGRVYTKVTWSLGELLAAGGAFDIVDPVAQDYSGTAGEPGFVEIRYRAAIPLFENTLDFDGGGGQPTADGGRDQIANLDNNRGASTRHGSPQTAPGLDDDGSAQALRNVAGVSGEYRGPIADGSDRTSSGTDAHTVDAVDVRVLKDVDDPEFTQGSLATYTLRIATSEYVGAELGTGADIRPNGLIDDFGDGTCPVFPAGVEVTPGASEAGTGIPRLRIGDPEGALSGDLVPADWNAQLGALGSACAYPSAASGASLTGATLTGIVFDPASGRFQLELAIDPLPAGAETTVAYTARQNALYAADDSRPGATTSGDSVPNHVELTATTQSIPGLDGVVSAGGADASGVWRVWDDSDAVLQASLSELSKHVLTRSAGVPDRSDIVDVPESEWVKTPEENEPFSPGDEAWYRIRITPPAGADVRNPRFTDFLPPGVSFDPYAVAGSGRPENIWVVPSSTRGLGSCQPANVIEWLDTFVPFDAATGFDPDGNILTFNLGADCFANTDDRFLPLDTTLEIYVKVTVTDVSAFGRFDLSENLAKYQQQNVAGDIFFLRDAAEIETDRQVRLVKGIRDIDGDPGPPASPSGNPFNSDVDHRQVVQGDEVAFRLDLTAPSADTSDYVIWDALPPGIKKADIKGVQADGTFSSATAALIEQTWVPETNPASPSYPGFWDAGEAPVGTGWTAKVYDFGEFPAEVGNNLRGSVNSEQRSIVVWEFTGTVPGSSPADDSADPPIPAADRGLTLGYTVVVPDGTDPEGGPAAQLTQNYENTASIVRYSAVNNGGGTSALVPTGEDTLSTGAADPDAGEYAIDDRRTVDVSDVYLPGAEIDKQLVSTEIAPTGTTPPDANNPSSAIVQGEYATFDYTVTIPAHTTVREAVLSDDGDFVGRPGNGTIQPGNAFPYKFVSATVDAAPAGVTITDATGADPAAHPSDFGFRTDTGKLIFPVSYTVGDDPETFTVRIVVWTSDVDASNTTASQARPNVPNNKTLRNTARFAHGDPANPSGAPTTLSDYADVQYREPNLSIAKAASPDTDIRAGQDITYTLTVSNANRVKSYDNVVVDTVPVGLRVNTAPLAAAGATFSPDAAALQNGLGGTITWSHQQFTQLAEIPTTAILTYTAQIDPATGGGRNYDNTARVTGYTLPSTLPDAATRRGDRTHASTERVTAATAAIDKGVRPAGGTGAFGATTSAPIGGTVEYQVDVTLHPQINYYDPRIVDDLPAGVSLTSASIVGPTIVSGAPALGGAWTHGHDPATNVHTWTYDGDIASSPESRTLRLGYEVDLTTAVAFDVNSLPNTARFTWGSADGAPEAERQRIDDTATVTVPNPALQIVKKVDGQDEITRDPGASFGYTLTVSQIAAGSTPAHNITVTDEVPEGVVVDVSSISPTPASADPGVGLGAGGTITWSLPGPLHPQSGTGTPKSILLGYEASFADSGELHATTDGLGTWLTNTADVTRFESFDSGGRVYTPGQNGQAAVTDTARVRPVFPSVTLDKTTTDGTTAYAGESFGWTLTLVNGGRGPAQTLDVTDLLPENWSYDDDSARISVGGAPSVPLAAPVQGSEDDRTTLTWNLGSAAPAAPFLPGTASGATEAQRSVVITFTATPGTDALTDAGVTRDDGTAVPHTNALRAATTDTSGATENADREFTAAPDTADAFLRSADLKLVKDAAGGVVDTGEASTNLHGLTAGSWVPGQAVVAGRYAQPQWRITVTNQGPDAGFGPFEVVDTQTLPAGVTAGTWSARYFSGPGDASGISLALTGSGTAADPFVIGDGATSLAADGSDRIVLRADVSVAADATASGAELNNVATVEGRTHEPDAKKPDNTDDVSKPLAPSADLAIDKTVSTAEPNAGSAITWQLAPSNIGPSVSVSTAANPITVTDTIPEGIHGVADPSNPTWTAAVPGGWPAEAGDTITWTYQGTALPVGAAPVITLSGVVDASWTPTSGPSGDGRILNTAVISPGGTRDPVVPNNTSNAPVTPDDATTLGISKTRVVKEGADWVPATETPEWGDPVSYLIEVVNNGPADARDVAVVDETPDGLSYDSHENVSGVWTRAAGGTNAAGTTSPAWDTFALDGPQQVGAGHATSFVVTYGTDATVPAGTPIENWAEASAENATNEPRDDDRSDSARVANLSIVKSHTGQAVAGEPLDYRIVATNEGPSVSDGPIEITDLLPAGFSYESGSAEVRIAGGAWQSLEPSVSGQLLSWTLLTGAGDTLAVDATIEIVLTTAVADTVREQQALVNRAEVDAPNDPDPRDDVWEDPTDVVTRADMTIEKTVAAGPWVAGTEVAYELTIRNAGPSAAPATVTDALPSGLTLVSMSGAGWDCDAAVAGAQSGACAYEANDGLHPVDTAADPFGSTITVVALIGANVPEGTRLLNEAVLDWNDSRGTHHDDDDAEITVHAEADLALQKTAVDERGDEIASAVAGRSARYALEVENLGPSDAVAPLTVVDTLPSGVSFVQLVAGSSANWTAEADPADPQRITFTRVPTGTGLAAGASAPTIVFEVGLDAALEETDPPRVDPIVNTAVVSSGTDDPNPGNDDDEAPLEIEREVDLSIAKQHDAGQVRIGDELPFEIVVTNHGPSEATGITVTDTVPRGLKILSEPGDDLGDGWTLVSVVEPASDPSSGGELIASYAGPLSPGESTPPLTIATRVTERAYDRVVNVAKVTGDETETRTDNNRAEDEVVVPPLATLVTTKTAVGSFRVGETGTYRITVKNLGPTEDPGPITVTDRLPDGLSFHSSPDDGVRVSGRTVTWTLEDGLAVGERARLTLVVNVAAAAYPSVTNTVSVSSKTELTPDSVTHSDATIEVRAADPLVVTGGDVAPWILLLALLLLLAGAGVYATGRRQRARNAE